MNFSILSPAEVRYKYARADNKKQILRVLADLTCATPKAVAQFLGVEYPESPGRFDRRKALKLYEDGKSDGEIADALGVTRLAVFDWRKADGLTANKEADSHDKRMEAYRMGLSDREAAKSLGIGRSTFRNWRYKHGLEPNGGKIA